MNLKVANLVAIELGVLIGIMSWLAYSRFESAEPRVAAMERRNSPAAPVAAVAPISDLGSQVSRALEDDADREEDQSIGEPPALPVQPHQYSPEAVQQYTALAAQQYYQQIAPRRYASAAVASNSSAAVAPAYTEVAQEPAAVSSDYVEPLQSVAYAEPNVVVYQPQFIVFSNQRSNQRRFPNRCRPALQSAAGTPITHRGPDGRGPHQSGSTESRPTKCLGSVPPRNPNVPSCKPGQESRPRGKR
jgi:hypothetical protein